MFFIGKVAFAEKELIEYVNDMGTGNYIFTGDYIPQAEKMEKPLEPYITEKEIKPGDKKVVEKKNLLNYFYSKLHPYILTDFNYNNNIYMTQFNKKDDRGNTTLAGARLVMGRADKDNTTFSANIGGKSDYYIYTGFNRQNPYASIDTATRLGKYKFLFRYDLKKDFTQSSFLDTGMEGFTDFMYNRAVAAAEAKFNRVELAVTYKWLQYDFSDHYKVSNNIQDNTMSIIGFYRPFSFTKTNLLAEYIVGKFDYTKAPVTDNNFFHHIVWIGAVGKMTDKLSGIIKVGYEALLYENAKDSFNFVTKGDFEYKFSPKTNFYLRFVSAGLRSANSAYGTYNGNYASLMCQHNFTPKFSGEIQGYVLERTGKEPKYTDTGYGWSAKTIYTYAKWIRMVLEYKHDYLNTRMSRNAGYINDIYSFKTEVGF